MMHLAKELFEQVNDKHAKLIQIKVYKRNTYAGFDKVSYNFQTEEGELGFYTTVDDKRLKVFCFYDEGMDETKVENQRRKIGQFILEQYIPWIEQQPTLRTRYVTGEFPLELEE